MYARVNRTRWRPERRDDAAQFTHDRIIPAYREQNGFRGYLLLTEPGGDGAMAITMWETEEDMEASAPVARALIPELGDVLVEPPVTETYEVTIRAEGS